MPRRRTRPRRPHHEPEAATWAREKAGLTQRALAAHIAKIADVRNCPLVVLSRVEHAWVMPQNSNAGGLDRNVAAFASTAALKAWADKTSTPTSPEEDSMPTAADVPASRRAGLRAFRT